MTLTTITALLVEASTLMGILIPMVVAIRKINDGQRCLLRSEMLRIYYHHRESQTIRQYEYENFMYLYNAYKALRGNSFIDKIYDEVRTWEVVS